ncbi:MAG: LPS export ABC transporter permease LptG [Thermodesulfobacteriota bacterium]
MMKRLDRYIFTEFVKLLLLTTAGFITIFILVDLFENMDNLVKYHVPITASLLFFIYKIPFIIGQVAPVAVLLSVLLSVGMLSMSGEMTAVRASGVRLLRVFIPVMIAGFLISLSVIFINEYFTPLGLKKTEAFKVQWFGNSMRGSFGGKGLWMRTNDSIINIRHLRPGDKGIEGITIYDLEKPFRLVRRIDAKKARWTGERWMTSGAVVRDFKKDGSFTETRAAPTALTNIAPPEELSRPDSRHMNLSMEELKRLIKILEAEGYGTHQYRTDLYARIAFPFVSFIMVLLGIPFPLRGARSGGIASGIGLCIIIAFSYWIVFALSTSLGSGGVVPPIIAAVFPNVLFLATAAYLLAHVKE